MSPPSRDQASFYFSGFAGFDEPNFTQVPNPIFDELAPLLTEAELRVLLYIVRRTFGFHRQSDHISLSQLTDGIRTRDGRQLDHGTGMSRKAVSQGCARLVEKGVITVQKRQTEDGENEINVYALRFRNEEKDGAGVVTQGNYRRERSSPRVVTEGYPQEIAKQKIVEQDIDVGRNSNGTLTQARTHRVNEVNTRAPRRAGKDRDPDPVIENMIQDFSREFHDSSSLRSNLTRARHLMDESDLDVETFAEVLYEARRRTKRRGNIEKPSTEETDRGWPGMKNKMPYFWRVVERILAEEVDEAAC